MVVGFNHNFKYKGAIYHVQTEDNGVKNPQIVTLLYSGGQILSSQKTSYADLCHATDLAEQVEELMKKQHQDMLRRLKNGEFDRAIAQTTKGAPVTDAPEVSPTVSPEPSAPRTEAVAPVAKSAVVVPDVGDSELEKLIRSYLLGDKK